MRVIDLSHWQGKVKYDVTASRGITRVFHKFTQGNYMLDSNCIANTAGFDSCGVATIPYHYFMPGIDPVAQLDYFLLYAEKQVLKVCDALVDVEHQAGIPADYASRLFAFLTTLERRTGIRPLIYTRASYWKMYLAKSYNWAGAYRVMFAHYKDNAGPSVCSPWAPNDWYLWQYTDRENGPYYGMESQQVDMSIDNGTISDHWSPPEDQLYYLFHQPVMVEYRISMFDRLTEYWARRTPNFRRD